MGGYHVFLWGPSTWRLVENWSRTTEFWQQHHVERWNVIHQMLSSGNSTQTETWANRKSSSRFKRLNQDWSGESESGRVPDDSREWCLDGLAPETVDSELALDLAVGDAVGATAFCLDAVLCGRQFDWQHKGMKQKVFRKNGGYWLPLFSRLSAGGGCFGGVYIIYTCVLGIYKSMAKLHVKDLPGTFMLHDSPRDSSSCKCKVGLDSLKRTAKDSENSPFALKGKVIFQSLDFQGPTRC